MRWRDRALHWLKVPADPAAPAGDEDILVFRAASNFYRYQQVNWFLKRIAAAIGLYFALEASGSVERAIAQALPDVIPLPFMTVTEHFILWWIRVFEVGAVAGFLLQALGSLILLRLDFEQRWYIVTDRSLRIRSGLIRMHEKTMTYANLQQVSIQQGPLQRLLGIADLEVSTAGGGKVEAGHEAKAQHVARLEGIEDASRTRDLILERLRQYRDAGLGDSDDAADRRLPGSADLEHAARALAAEARSLRQQLAPSVAQLQSPVR